MISISLKSVLTELDNWQLISGLWKMEIMTEDFIYLIKRKDSARHEKKNSISKINKIKLYYFPISDC